MSKLVEYRRLGRESAHELILVDATLFNGFGHNIFIRDLPKSSAVCDYFGNSPFFAKGAAKNTYNRHLNFLIS
jgi:hypothetical protein